VEQSFLGHQSCIQIIPSKKKDMDEENDVVMQEDQMHHMEVQCVTISSEGDTTMLEPEPSQQ
jgi:hypothetical protein